MNAYEHRQKEIMHIACTSAALQVQQLRILLTGQELVEDVDARQTHFYDNE
jgi:hypothetical protein